MINKEEPGRKTSLFVSFTAIYILIITDLTMKPIKEKGFTDTFLIKPYLTYKASRGLNILKFILESITNSMEFSLS
jgi:hypothetical protein